MSLRIPAANILSLFAPGCLIVVMFAPESTAIEPVHPQISDSVKVAAVQISGYDKGDLPTEGYDPTATIIPYIDRAAQDKAADGGNALEKYGRCGPREASIIRPQEPTMHRPEHPVDLNEAF